MKHYTIPFFIIHRGCPGQCVFCDQNKITGQEAVTPQTIDETIKKYLNTIKRKEDHVIEVGFFGGTFTGLSVDLQKEFLFPVEKYINSGLIKSIRLSTRPDYISETIVAFLKERQVKCIELGVQSMSDKVLKVSKRGYTEKTVEHAANIVTSMGLDLVFQMMLGLPGSTIKDEFYAAKKAKQLKAKEARIYPLVVMKGTELAEIWKSGEYLPLSEDEAIERSAKLIVYFETHNIKVIRCGLHPSEGLISHENYLAGPFHPAFRQKAESWIFSKMLEYIKKNINVEIDNISYNPKDQVAVYGFEKCNAEKINMLSNGQENFLIAKDNVMRGTLLVHSDRIDVTIDRKYLKIM